jgi:hypothetical protein
VDPAAAAATTTTTAAITTHVCCLFDYTDIMIKIFKARNTQQHLWWRLVRKT